MSTWKEIMGPAAIWAWSKIRSDDWMLYGIPFSMKADTVGRCEESRGSLEMWSWAVGNEVYYSVRTLPRSKTPAAAGLLKPITFPGGTGIAQ